MGVEENSGLPLSSAPDIILTVATPSECNEVSKVNGFAWADPLSLEQYLGREDHLADQALTRNGQITRWILTIANARPEHRSILSACETIPKVGFIARAGCQQADEVVTHGICTVFCRPEYRRRGYAGRMIQELGKKLDQGWQQPAGAKSAFSLLWSDIGLQFYNSYGWKPCPSTHLSLDPITDEVYRATRQRLHLPECKELFAHDLETICPDDVAQTRSHLHRLANSTSTPPTTYIAIAPDYAHMAWHHAREEYISHALKLPVPAVKGCTIPSFLSPTPSDPRHPINPSLIWNRRSASSPSESKLYALHLVLPYSYIATTTTSSSATSEAELPLIRAIASLLLRAQREASISGLHHFELWSPRPLVVAAAKMLKPVEEEEKDDVDIVESRTEESICSLRWNGGLGPEGGQGEKVEWVCNERYAWC